MAGKKTSSAGLKPQGMVAAARFGLVVGVVWTAVWTGLLLRDLRAGESWWSQPGTLGALVVGAFVLRKAWLALGRAQRYTGTVLQCDPAVPRAGESLRVELLLPDGAQPHLEQGRATLCLKQTRVDDSGSSTSTHLAWEQRASAPLMQRAGGSRVTVTFELPPGAPASGTRRDGNLVKWSIELHDGGGRADLNFDIEVEAGDPAAAAAAWRGEVPEADAPVDPGVLPQGVMLLEGPWGAELRFRRRGAKVFAVLCLLGCGSALLGARAAALTGGPHGEPGVAAALLPAAGSWLLLVLAVHAGTVRWRLRVNDDGADIDRSSWLWPRWRHVSTAELAQLPHRLVYSATGGADQGLVEHHSVYAQGPGGTGPKLTPAVPLASGAQAVAAWVRQALHHRQPRFAPGAQRPASGPSVPAWAAVLAWLVVAAAGLAIVVFGLR